MKSKSVDIFRYLDGEATHKEREALECQLSDPEFKLKFDKLKSAYEVIDNEKHLKSNPYLASKVENRIFSERRIAFLPTFQKIVMGLTVGLMIFGSAALGVLTVKQSSMDNGVTMEQLINDMSIERVEYQLLINKTESDD